MATLKYKIIKTEKQYFQYCDTLELLLETPNKSGPVKDEIELLTFLLEKWDNEHNTLDESDPVELLKFFMDEHDLKAVNLADILNISKGLVSDILNYKKGFSKEVIRKLSERFKVSHEAFNRPYKLVLPVNSHIRNARGRKPATKRAA